MTDRGGGVGGGGLWRRIGCGMWDCGMWVRVLGVLCCQRRCWLPVPRTNSNVCQEEEEEEEDNGKCGGRGRGECGCGCCV